MKLLDVMAAAADPAALASPAGETEITALAYDNRTVQPGTLFFCVPGFTRDGHDFAADAVTRGAAALVVERELGLGVPEMLVPSVRAAMAPAAAAFAGDPTADLQVVGITGTNGKTTTAFLVRALLEAAGRQTGLLGTVTSFVGGKERAVQRTTAEAIELQRDFRAMLGGGDVACVMEVSSHALELHRADAIHFAAAIFTNLTQDHLDFHPTMEEYFAAKHKLFAPASGEAPGVNVVNVDDPYGQRLAAGLRASGSKLVTTAIDHDADYRATDLRTGLTGSTFTALTPEGPIALRTPLPGRFNVQNVLGAVAAVRALGVSLQQIAAALPQAGRVPGRFEPVEEGQEFAVLVDYAHTPDSLDNVLQAARGLTDKRVLTVFGCGGDRDRGKRPLMGEIAVRLADEAYVTSDNPRSEDPEEILRDIVFGTGEGPHVHVEVDRRRSIFEAIAAAQAGDVVVIAGKGHEQGQEFAGGEKLPFDDVTVAREALRARNGEDKAA
ncbi:MAG TPA: UDP-N-acetylmuramoyl-L-alanyl-D-glutamate--2,6-diaminopimelate ligase [Conexibacter sp.]|jgi:UDP-N-acetylmuramoyl-L-alanyl-D-glutamate--2,6-diaminopimelate ligase